MRKGDRVTATKDIGGVLRERVLKGTDGVVTEAGGWGSDTRVRFRVPGLFGDRQVEIRVEPDEVD